MPSHCLLDRASCWRFSGSGAAGSGGAAPTRPLTEMLLLSRRAAIFLRRSLFLGAAGMLSSASAAASKPPRLRPMVPPDLDASQQQLYDTIVDTRLDIVGKAALFDEHGALRGPWNAEVASPALGQHLERLATAVRSENSLEPRLYEVTAL
jgi:hypothetical protein